MTDIVVAGPTPPAGPAGAVAGAAAPTTRTVRHEAICAAVFELLGEVGYDRMSMDAVAARARASKATIYRAWPAKPDLVKDALEYYFGETPPPPDTGSLRCDLLALMDTANRVVDSADGAVITGLLSAATRNPGLSETLFSCIYETKHGIYETIINHATARGELAVGVDPQLLHEVLHAMVLTHMLQTGGRMDQEFVVHVIDDVLIPVLCHRAARTSEQSEGGAATAVT